MISVSIVVEIDRLLAEGELTQRAIAEKLGVSRGTVNAIATGRRGLHGRGAGESFPRQSAAVKRYLPPAVLPKRCPLCGHLVQTPCLICEARQQQRQISEPRLVKERVSRRPRPAPQTHEQKIAARSRSTHAA